MQLVATRGLWEHSQRLWVTFKKPDAESLLQDERVVWCYYPTNRNLVNLARNFRLAGRVLRKERPDVIVSTGAGAAIPYFLLGRLFGCVLVYIEVYDRIDSATITGRICHRLAHVFALQWEDQKANYPRGVLVGPLV